MLVSYQTQKLTTKARHATNIHDLNGNLTIQTVKRTQNSYMRQWVLDCQDSL